MPGTWEKLFETSLLDFFSFLCILYMFMEGNRASLPYQAGRAVTSSLANKPTTKNDGWLVRDRRADQ